MLVSAASPVVLLAGNPNSGKTTLFNRLTGSRAKVANYPGVTVSALQGTLHLDGAGPIELVDLPGIYSLSARSPEEQIAVDAILPRGRRPDAVVVVSDATALARNLYLVLQVVETGVPTVLALTMMDEARAAGLAVDTDLLAQRLGVEVVELVASTGEGQDRLLAALRRTLGAPLRPPRARTPLDPELECDLEGVERAVRGAFASRSETETRAWTLWAALSVGDDELGHVGDELRHAVAEARARASARGVDLDLAIVGARFRLVDDLLATAAPPVRTHARTETIDAVLTHPVAGLVVFVVVMLAVFQALFSGAEPLVHLIEGAVAGAQATL